MRKYIRRAFGLATSGTAKDTYILFAGNIASAFLGFVFTLLVARALSVFDFGVFSAINNLVVILVSASEIGISAGVVNFISDFRSKGDKEGAEKFLKASLLLRLLSATILVLPVALFAGFFAQKFLATESPSASYWTVILAYGLVLWGFFPVALQASRRFFASVASDLSLGTIRVIVIFLFLFFGGITLSRSLQAFTIGAAVSVVVGFGLIGLRFLKAKIDKGTFSKILHFSGWLGVNNLVASISGRLDITMLAALAGATTTGLYSISSRLAYFIIVLASSLSAVLATRLASFGNKEEEKKYLFKASLATLPILLGICVWILIAQPFVTILFGEKYASAVPVFRLLAASTIPFILTTPAAVAIIYAMKKPVYIGVAGIVQLILVLSLNLLLIPKLGPLGPAGTLLIVNSLVAVYDWVIVLRYYGRK